MFVSNTQILTYIFFTYKAKVNHYISDILPRNLMHVRYSNSSCPPLKMYNVCHHHLIGLYFLFYIICNRLLAKIGLLYDLLK